MGKPTMLIGRTGNSYKFAFEADDGKITAQVSVALTGKPDTRTEDEKKTLALKKLKKITKALNAAIKEEGA